MNIKSQIEPILGDALSRLDHHETQGLAFSLVSIQDLIQEGLTIILSQEVIP